MKRVLILANHCLSESNANGRTLSNLLVGYPKALLAQFCLQSDAPDFSRCAQYFAVSDRDALNALRKLQRVGRRLEPQKADGSIPAAGTGSARNALTMLLREIVWRSGAWKRGGFRRFVEEFQPEVLLLQAGDCAFMFRIARTLAKKYQIPLVIYNSEGYYFKNYDYFRANGLAHRCYGIFRRMFCREFRRTMRVASFAVYSCEELNNAYAREFSCPAQVIYTATQMKPSDMPQSQKLSAVYLGNLSVGRDESLIDIAQALKKFNADAFLDIYGKPPSAESEARLRACAGIRLHGFVPYAEVCRIMAAAPLLVHAENFSDFYREDLKFAFSTKLADCLASGRPFLLYAPRETAAVKYMQKMQCAYVATSREELEDILRQLYEQPQTGRRYLTRASEVVRQNHDAESNAARFQRILNQ